MQLGITVCGVWPVALVVRSPDVLARVSQASVAFVFAFAGVVAYLALGSTRPKQHAGEACLSIEGLNQRLLNLSPLGGLQTQAASPGLMSTQLRHPQASRTLHHVQAHVHLCCKPLEFICTPVKKASLDRFHTLLS